MQGIVWASLWMGKTRQYPGPPGNISNLKLDFSWLVLWICFIYFAKLESSIVKLNRSVSVLGQRGVACSHTTMLAILDHSRAGMIGLFFVFFFHASFFLYIFHFLSAKGLLSRGSRFNLFLFWTGCRIRCLQCLPCSKVKKAQKRPFSGQPTICPPSPHRT